MRSNADLNVCVFRERLDELAHLGQFDAALGARLLDEKGDGIVPPGFCG